MSSTRDIEIMCECHQLPDCVPGRRNSSSDGFHEFRVCFPLYISEVQNDKSEALPNEIVHVCS